MTEEQQRLSFGGYLNSMRLEAGLGLDRISEESKISRHTLQAIEEENHAKLPEPVYVVAFIRIFAEMVGADGEWAVSNYARSRKEFFGYMKTEKKYAAGKRSVWPRFFLGAALVLFIAATSFLAYSFIKKNIGAEAAVERSNSFRIGERRKDLPNPGESVNQAAEKLPPGIDREATRKPAHAGEVKSAPIEKRTVSTPKKTAQYELKIEASEETWVKVIVDGRKAEEYDLKPGHEVILKADSKYNILVGNAGGVKMNLNGKPVHVPGKTGQMVNVDLP